MNWGAIFGLDAGTVKTIQWCFNAVIRVTVVSLTWAFLLGVGWSLNWLINNVLSSLEASEALTEMTSLAVLAFVVVLAIAATITSLSDVIALTLPSIRAAIGKSQDSNAGGSPDGEQKSAPD